MKRKEKFLCNECNELTRLDIKTRRVRNDIKHSYAECENCGYKSTVYYTNKHIMTLMNRQKKEKDIAKKNILSQKINEEMEELKKQVV